jgi:hypothetical protein
VQRQFSSVSLLPCFEICARDVILLLRWLDRRSSTTIGIALTWGVDWYIPIMHWCGGSTTLTPPFTGSIPVGTDCALLSNWVIPITISYNYWFNCVVLNSNHAQKWFNCYNYLYYWVNHDWTVTMIDTNRGFSINLYISNQLPRFFWFLQHIAHRLCNVHQSKQSIWLIIIFRCTIAVSTWVPAMNFKNLNHLLDSKMKSWNNCLET